MKKTVVLTLALALSLAVAGGSFASDHGYDEHSHGASAGIYDSGWASDNKAEVKTDSSFNINNSNSAVVNTVVSGNANTGLNNISGNSMAGTLGLLTGNAANLLVLSQDINSTEIEAAQAGDDCLCDPYAGVAESGDESTNESKIDLKADFNINNENEAAVGTDADGNANSGLNSIVENGGQDYWAKSTWEFDLAELSTWDDYGYGHYHRGGESSSYAKTEHEGTSFEEETTTVPLDIAVGTGDASNSQSLVSVVNHSVIRAFDGMMGN